VISDCLRISQATVKELLILIVPPEKSRVEYRHADAANHERATLSVKALMSAWSAPCLAQHGRSS
jgi:hypothetical protein